jgi:BirA family biotin operon repressor/biotin-[acetyl-CoA-carboxylase] ligase
MPAPASANPLLSPVFPPSGAIPPWRIDDAVLSSLLAGAAKDWPIALIDETGSTNADLMAACRQTEWADTASVRLAYRQTAGRGRRGRPWRDQSGLMFSVAMPLALAPARLSGLSLAVGLAVAEGLEDCDPALGRAVKLKWPNDLEIGGRKLAGILIEAVPAGPRRGWVVIGIGLNLARDTGTEAELGRELAGVSEAMRGFDFARDPARVFAALLNRLALMRETFLVDGFAPMAARWSARDAYADQPVRLLHDARVVAEGTARGVDGDGHLLLETASGLERIASGEVSLRQAGARA